MRSQFGKLIVIGLVSFFLAIGAFFINPQVSLAMNWEQLTADGLGGGAANQTAVRLVTFNGKIYASIGNPLTGVKIFSSSDGQTWTQVNANGFGFPANGDAVLLEYNSELYAGTITSLPGNATQLWKTSNGTTWTQVSATGFGDPTNLGIVGMSVFNGKLYIGTTKIITGAEVYSLDSAGNLNQVNADGFGDLNNTDIWSLNVYNGALYAGTQNFATGAQIWKTTTGESWSKIMDGGFGDSNNQRINALFNFRGKQYAGTMNNALAQGTGTEVWRTTTSDTSWEQANTDGFGDALTNWTGDEVAVVNGAVFLGTRNNTNGARLFTSTNGSTWTQEGATGFGDPGHNYAIYAVSFNGRVYLGISATTGAEIWRSGSMDTLSITTTSIDDQTVGTQGIISLQASAGTAPLIWSVTSGNLPDGQSLSSDGTIQGTPQRSGSYTFVVTVTDSGRPQQMASREFTIKVVDTLPETGGNSYLNWAGNLI